MPNSKLCLKVLETFLSIGYLVLGFGKGYHTPLITTTCLCIQPCSVRSAASARASSLSENKFFSCWSWISLTACTDGTFLEFSAEQKQKIVLIFFYSLLQKLCPLACRTVIQSTFIGIYYCPLCVFWWESCWGWWGTVVTVNIYAKGASWSLSGRYISTAIKVVFFSVFWGKSANKHWEHWGSVELQNS